MASEDKNNDVLDVKHWENVVQQIYDTIGTDTAIINNYGIILA